LTDLLIIQEHVVVGHGQRVDHVEPGILRDDKQVRDQRVEPLAQFSLGLGVMRRRVVGGTARRGNDVGRVVEHVRGVEDVVILVLHDGRRKRVERDEVGDQVGCGVLLVRR
jgi:hypothetical protein